MRRAIIALLGVLASLPSAALAQGDDGDLQLMHEPHSFVDVIDAFDEGDDFDLNISVGYRNRYTYGTIQRERGVFDPAGDDDPNRAAHNWVNVANHSHTQNILDVGLEVGIFRDLALYAGLPIILSDDRSLSAAAGTPAGILVDPEGMPLFDVPFNSPTRSGFDYIRAGLAWSITNQNRDRAMPTWMLMIEGRFNLGDPLTACQGGATPNCRNWSESAGGDWSFVDGGTDAGETRGTDGIRIETRASWRSGYIEPYAGLMFQIEWPVNAELSYLPAGNINGFVNEQPPILGRLTGGLAIIPWEDRASFQRFVIDARFMGGYVSEGRDYSPLFDALGTSQSRYLTVPALEGVPGPGAGNLEAVPFLGLTDTQSHAELGARLGLEMRAARFLNFSAGVGVWYIAPYIITFTDACNPNFEAPAGDARRGTCVSGIINPHHRPILGLPGQQFRVDEQVRLDFQFKVTGMF